MPLPPPRQTINHTSALQQLKHENSYKPAKVSLRVLFYGPAGWGFYN